MRPEGESWTFGGMIFNHPQIESLPIRKIFQSVRSLHHLVDGILLCINGRCIAVTVSRRGCVPVNCPLRPVYHSLRSTGKHNYLYRCCCFSVACDPVQSEKIATSLLKFGLQRHCSQPMNSGDHVNPA